MQNLELPANTDAERNLIGLTLLDGRITTGAKDLTTTDFHNPNYRRVWSAFLELECDAHSIDALSTYEVLKRNNPQITETFTLAELTNTTVGMVRVNENVFTSKIKLAAHKRYLMKELYAQVEALSKGGADTIPTLRKKLGELEISGEMSGNFKSLADILEREVKPALQDLRHGITNRISTGFEQIDNLIGGGISGSDVMVVAALAGIGKALALTTPIPTTSGWTTMGDIKIGEQVFDENGKVCNVTNATQVMFDHDCYLVKFSDGTEIIADADHEWLTSTYQSRNSEANSKKYRDESGNLKIYGSDQTHKRTFPSIVTTKEIFETVRTVRNGNRANHLIENARPIDLPNKYLPIPPYVLGSWLGDGKSTDGRFYTADLESVTDIVNFGYEVRKNVDRFAYSIIGLKVQLRELGVLNDKHIPAEYLRSSVEQRLELLQGLMDTDGCCAESGAVEFCVTNQTLAENFLELVNSLGIKAVLKKSEAKIKGVFKSFRWRISFYTDLPVFRLKRKLDRQKRESFRGTHNKRYIVAVEKVESVPVRCIEVDSPSHLYLASKSFIPTHNSAFVLQLAANIAKQNIPVAFLSGEMSNKENVLRLLSQSAKVINLNSATRLFENELDYLNKWAEELKKLPMYFDSQTSDLQSVHRALRFMVEEKGVRVLVVDYIQLFKLNRFDRQTRFERIAEVSQEIKRIAMEYGIAIIEVAQFNREGAKSLKTSMHDLEGSSQLEKDASLIFIIDRDTDSSDVTLRIVKGRNSGKSELRGQYKGFTLEFEF